MMPASSFTDEVNPIHALLRKVRQTLAPPTDLRVSQFAERSIILTNGPLAGTKWKTIPYQKGIMDGFHEPGVEILVVMGSSQWGKTSILVNLCAYHIKHDPCAQLIVEPTLKPMAEDFAKNRLGPVLEASPDLRDLVTSDTTLLKTYPGGMAAIAGSNSASSLASRPVRFLGLDEIDRYERELAGEGNTISIAMKRTTTFRRRRRIFLTSSPTLVDSPIHSWWQRGDQRYYFVPCPDCGHWHRYEWQFVKWNKREEKSGREVHDPDSAWLECPACFFKIDDDMRKRLLDPGEWRASNPDRADKKIISFHLWEAYSPMSSLSEIVASFLRARAAQKTGDQSEMHSWQNTTLGEPVQPNSGDGLEGNEILRRIEQYDEDPEVRVPLGACCLTCAVDTQDDRLEALVWAWGPGEESWLVDRKLFLGDPEQPAVWAQVDKLLDSSYLHASGQRLQIQSTCVDTAGHKTNPAYQYCSLRAARRVYAIIGRAGNKPMVSSPTKKHIARSSRTVQLFTVGVDAGKALFTSRLQLTEKGPGYVHLPAEDFCDEELALQFASERLVKKFDRGVMHQVWKKIRTRNEGLDMTVYAIAALKLLNPQLGEMLRILNANRVDRQPKLPDPQTKTKRRVRRSKYIYG